MLQIITDQPPRLRKLNSRIPRDLETICLKCLEKDPRNRYATARDLADELDRFLAGRSIHARPLSAIGRAWRWCKRYPAIAFLSASVVLSLLAGLAGTSSQWACVRQEVTVSNSLRNEAEKKTKQVSFERDLAHQAERLARRRLYVADVNLAQVACEQGNTWCANRTAQSTHSGERRRGSSWTLPGIIGGVCATTTWLRFLLGAALPSRRMENK